VNDVLKQGLCIDFIKNKCASRSVYVIENDARCKHGHILYAVLHVFLNLVINIVISCDFFSYMRRGIACIPPMNLFKIVYIFDIAKCI
jgi:hypothetical protein